MEYGPNNVTCQWYSIDKSSGVSTEINNATSLTLSNVDDNFNYKVVIIYDVYDDFPLERTYKAVCVDDAEADLNYYKGLNYVNSDNGVLPTGQNQNIYDESNLVRVTIGYSAEEVFGTDLISGTVSLSEKETEYVYHKYYPVVNGKAKIELIDNPFTNRPKGKGFNNWVSEDNTGTISFDSVVYKRYIEVNVSYVNGVPKDIGIALHAQWTNATVVEKTGANTWATVFTSLDTEGMKALSTSNDYTGESMAGYYLRTTLSGGTSLVGYYDANGNALSGTAVAGTNYYKLIQSHDGNKTYDSNNAYYYMVTRDTNIVYLTGNISNTWASGQSKPFTFTGQYGGVDYSNTYTWTVSGIPVYAYNDTTIENMKISSAALTTTTVPAAVGNGSIYGNYNNLKIGRGLVRNRNKQ